MVFVSIFFALLLVFAIWQYNKLVGLRQLGKNAWSDVDVYLKRRAELIPNLVATVKGYAGYEQATLERVVQARNTAASAGTPAQRASAEGALTQGIAGIFAIAEAYPDLKASESFLELQRNLAASEQSIAEARQYYNAVVRDNNTLIESFPSGVFASIFGFRPMEFFEVETASEREAPSAKV
ncbi:MAG: LemA family protein [Fimbriimonas ginsengisoli]|uniref:LemA family protein n=1 Tax=Fimbriimonas ginsengisoli TaxID=1005039 RepID=A0A931LWM5_FIMGI|nr:LemA family protein [Fimbriimonas ginsengisoli]